MPGVAKSLILLASLFAWLNTVNCERLRGRIYKPIRQGGHFCFRKANGTHQFGCASELDGNVGVLHLLESDDDIKWVKEKAPSGTKYIGMVTPEMFTFGTLKALEEAEVFTGVILVTSADPDVMGEPVAPPGGFSSDQKCPNAPTSRYAPDQCSEGEGQNLAWNPLGSDIGVYNWPFPVIYITNANVTKELVTDCYDKYNRPGEDGEARPWPLCAVELDSFMHQAVSTEVCVRRQEWSNPFSPSRWCDPLGDQSVFMLLTPPKEQDTASEYPDDSIVLVTARLDAMGMFDQMQIGSETPVTGIVTLLAVAKLLADFQKFVPGGSLEYQQGVNNVLFAFLNGESYDYIGSSKMIYDMMNSEFPCVTNSGKSTDEDCAKVKDMKAAKWPKVKPASVRNYLELGQMYSGAGATQELFVHVDPRFQSNRLLQDLRNSFDRSGVSVQAASNKARGLPPASITNFLRLAGDKPAMLLTDFDQRMGNKYYHSMYDNFVQQGIYNSSVLAPERQDIVTKLCRVSESVASYVLYQATGERTVFNMSTSTMNEMLDCFMNSSRCGLFARASTPELPPQKGVGPEGPYPQYVQVVTSFNMHSFFVQRVLAYLTGDDVKDLTSQDNCTAPSDQNVYRYFWLRGDREGPECSLRVNGSHSTTDGAETVCGVCRRTTSWLSIAESPAFLVDGYDFARNTTFAAWTESQWQVFAGRIFLKGSPGLEQGYLAAGIIVAALSLLLVYWANLFSEDIFPGSAPPPPPSAADENGPPVTAETQDIRHQETPDRTGRGGEAVIHHQNPSSSAGGRRNRASSDGGSDAVA